MSFVTINVSGTRCFKSQICGIHNAMRSEKWKRQKRGGIYICKRQKGDNIFVKWVSTVSQTLKYAAEEKFLFVEGNITEVLWGCRKRQEHRICVCCMPARVLLQVPHSARWNGKQGRYENKDWEYAENKVWNNCLGEWERMKQEDRVWLSGRIKDPLEVHGHEFKMRSVSRVLSFPPATFSCKNAETV